ncbi:MAG: chloride channel protein [Muribaculaceae bacterium]|nr:chloride channel protein [Muribaculaceae bacterium]
MNATDPTTADLTVTKFTKFDAWRKRYVPDYVFILILASVVGCLAGLGAYIFKHLISLVAGIFTPHISDWGHNWWIIAVPLIGILLTGIFTRYIIHTNLTHGCAQLLQDLKEGSYRLRRNIIYSPIVGGTITLGMGGSAGGEGPIAYAGAAIGSNFGQWLGLQPRMLKVLIGCGAGAGIAGIFSAPIGGLMFTLELLRIELTTVSVLAVAVSCLASYLTIYTCSGFHTDLMFNPVAGVDLSHLIAVVALGIFCGVYSLYYSKVMHHLDIFYKNIHNPWLRNVTGGVAVGGFLLLFPALYSTGYPVMGHIINGDYMAMVHGSVLEPFMYGPWMLMTVAMSILLLKCWACASSNSSGGVAGDFAPTLFAGCIAGVLFGFMWESFGGCTLPVGTFAYLGMAGVMAGAIQAPLMAIFITMEMSGGYEFALPLTITSVISYIILRCGMKGLGLTHRLIEHHGFHN